MSVILEAMMRPGRLEAGWQQVESGYWTRTHQWMYLEIYRVSRRRTIQYRWRGPGSMTGLEPTPLAAAIQAQKSILPYLMRVAAMKAYKEKP